MKGPIADQRDVMITPSNSNRSDLLPAAWFAFVFLHERPSGREWMGVAMVGAGVLVLRFKRQQGGRAHTAHTERRSG